MWPAGIIWKHVCQTLAKVFPKNSRFLLNAKVASAPQLLRCTTWLRCVPGEVSGKTTEVGRQENFMEGRWSSE
jgi:hypothetical protein